MGIIAITRDQTSDVNIVRIITTDNLAIVSAANYILNQTPIIENLMHGLFTWLLSDTVLINASDGWEFFTISPDFHSLNPLVSAGSGTVSPGNANQLAYYATSGNTVSGLTSISRSSLTINSSGIPTWIPLTDGQFIIGSTAGSPAASSLIAGSNITITPGSNSITISASGSSVTPSALTEANDTNITLTLSGTPATALLQAVEITAGWTGLLSFARGGTNANLTASAGAITYSTASAMAFTAPGVTGQLFRSAGTATPTWTTSTYPATNAINTLLYASSANVMSSLAASNNGILITNNSGTPFWLVNSVTPGFVLTANTSSPPSWQSPTVAAAVWTVGSGTDSGIGGDGTSTASGNYSLTYGSGSNTTTRDNSFTFGIANTNSVQRSVIFGSNNLNSGSTQGYNFAFGDSNTINSAYSIIFGSSCQLNFGTNGYSFIFGNSSIGNGDYSWAIGNGAQTNNNGSWVVGDSNIFPVQDTAANQFCLTFNGGYFLNGSSLTASTQLALNANKQVISVPTYTIGQYALGGVIFWLNPTKTSGLVAAIVDQDGGSGVEWYNGTFGLIGALADGVLLGQANTVSIIAFQGAGTYAASVCTAYTVTVAGVTYNDWYLPDQIELNLLYQQRTAVNTTAVANGGTNLVGVSYWSSLESQAVTSGQNAYESNMGTGTQATQNKIITNRVRAIRAF